MPSKSHPNVVVRIAVEKDSADCGRICYDAFATVSAAHGFPCDLPGPEVGAWILSSMFTTSGFYCVVAEHDGRIAGSNCLDERALIAGIGPITIDPKAQNLGIGGKLMQAVMDRAKDRAGIRLVQAAYHNRSLSLYAGLGFEVREPLSCMQGRTSQRSVPGCTVRSAQLADLDACSTLCRQVHGFDRAVELAQAIEHGSAVVTERDGRISGYATSVAFFGHAVAETNLDLQALIASAESMGGPGILVPSRNTALFRWCLSNGLRVVQPMTLMTVGLYNEPAGAWFPSIAF